MAKILDLDVVAVRARELTLQVVELVVEPAQSFLLLLQSDVHTAERRDHPLRVFLAADRAGEELLADLTQESELLVREERDALQTRRERADVRARGAGARAERIDSGRRSRRGGREVVGRIGSALDRLRGLGESRRGIRARLRACLPCARRRVGERAPPPLRSTCIPCGPLSASLDAQARRLRLTA